MSQFLWELQEAAAKLYYLDQPVEMDTAPGIISAQLLVDAEADDGSHGVVSQRFATSQSLVHEAECFADVHQGLGRWFHRQRLLLAKEVVDKRRAYGDGAVQDSEPLALERRGWTAT
jgi:hypothetical protein